MCANSSGETRSYRDPLGEQARLFGDARRRREARFPQVEQSYDGFYCLFEPLGKRGISYLVGGEGIIGSELQAAFEADDTRPVALVARDGEAVAFIDGEPAERLRRLREKGWTVRLALSLVMYHPFGKRFVAEAACFGCAGDNDEAVAQALDSFIANITYRINKGDHPRLDLTQDQFIKVVESKGAWYLTKRQPLPPREEGTMYYRRRRTLTEGLVATAIKGGRGCKIAATVFWALVALAVVLVVYLLVR
ncbi:MAG: hypothetical protein LBD25_07575 [Coriobacteriales bacterium]|jgi:hypothetical protein|nr:hypothetical protein [Coriobacteriales bacterium]